MFYRYRYHRTNVIISCFQGSRSDKEYLYLDDMLTKQLIALDGIDTAGREEIRQLRKDSIAFVNSCLSRLDEKATEHGAQQQQHQAKESTTADQS
jgi:BCL2-associated athanogene 3